MINRINPIDLAVMKLDQGELDTLTDQEVVLIAVGTDSEFLRKYHFVPRSSSSSYDDRGSVERLARKLHVAWLEAKASITEEVSTLCDLLRHKLREFFVQEIVDIG